LTRLRGSPEALGRRPEVTGAAREASVIGAAPWKLALLSLMGDHFARAHYGAAKQLELAFAEHEWTRLRHPDGRLVEGVDIGIASLIEALWARGFQTKSSCQNGGEVYGWCPVGMAYVSFASETECKRFARELGELRGYDPRRRVELVRLSAYPAAQTAAFEARLIAEATQRLTRAR
jgi:hypothetical protein